MPSSIQVTQRLLALIEEIDSSAEQINQAARTLLQSTKGTSASNLRNVLETLSLSLDVEDPARASVLLMVCGSLVEFGAKTNTLHEPLIRQLRKIIEQAGQFQAAVLSQMPASTEKEANRESAFKAAAKRVATDLPDDAAAWMALDQSYLAGITLFSVSREARTAARCELSLVRELAEFHPGAAWLWKMLQVLDDEPLLVIEPATRKGMVGRMNGIAENFQLNVLLMEVFPRGWFRRRRVSKGAVDVARGIGPQETEEVIQGTWNLYTAAALRADRTLPDPNDFEASSTWVWNEGVPADLPQRSGHRVVLLGPTAYARTWNSQRAFKLLPADISKVRKLTTREVEDWLDRLKG